MNKTNTTIAELQIGDRVVLVKDICGFSKGHKGTVDEHYTSRDRNYNPIPAVMVAWDLENPNALWQKKIRDGITEEEQTEIGFINKLEE